MTGIMPLARKLGEMLDAREIPPLETMDRQVWKMRRKDLWPPEVWDEMEAIWKDDAGEAG